jgi:hypothetical protein
MRASRLALLAALLLGSSRADAAACCLSSSAFGIGRLASWEDFAFILGTSASPVAGNWDALGTWHPNPGDYSENELRAHLSALVALHDRLQLSGRLPWVMTTKSAGPLSESGNGLGDSQLALRYEPVFQGEVAWLPEIAVTAGLTMPTGRPTSAAQTILGSDVTGRGAWMLSASVVFELARDIWFAQVGGGLTYALPQAGVEPGTTQQLGPGVQVTVAGGIQVLKPLVVSVVGRYGWEGQVVVDGKPLPQSRQYDLGIGPALAWKITQALTLQAGADFGIPASGLGENRQGRATFNLAMRWAHL